MKPKKNNSLFRVIVLLALLASFAPAPGIAKALPLSATPPVDMFQLPWEQGLSWVAYGGFDNGTRRANSSPHNYKMGGAVDFAPHVNMVVGEDTSNFWVVAAAAGTIKTVTSCYVIIDHGNGWLTEYWHLANVQVLLGQQVSRNQRLGVVADNKLFPVCTGNEHPGPHLHFVMRPIMKDTKYSGWTINYNIITNKTTFTKNGQTLGLLQPILNIPSLQVVLREPIVWDTLYKGSVDAYRHEKWPLQLTEQTKFDLTVTPTAIGVIPLIVLLNASGTEIARGTGTLSSTQPAGSYFVQIQSQAGTGFYNLIAHRDGPSGGTVTPTPTMGTPVASGTPVFTNTPTSTGTLVSTSTPTPTNTPVVSATPVFTNTPTLVGTLVPTSTPVFTSTSSIPSSTPVPTDTPTPTSIVVPTNTPVFTSTPVSSATPISTDTPAPTSTPVFTNTPLSTDTPTPTGTLIPTNTPIPSLTAVFTNTPIATSTPVSFTNTPTPINTFVFTSTPFTTGTPVILEPYVLTSSNPSSINMGDTSQVMVSLNNIPAQGYTSAEFTCTYDPALVEVSNISVWDLFGTDAVSGVFGPQNGSFILGIAGSNGNKATTSGIAFTFNAKGLQGGQTVIECKARVSEGLNVLQNILSIPSNFTIAGIIPTPTVAATSVPTSASLIGQVLASKLVTIRLYNPDNSIAASTTSNPDGTFSITAPGGTYTVVATAEGFLSAQGSVTLVNGNISSKPVVSLIAGDIDNNGVINQLDALTVGMNYNNTTPVAADLNNDGVINVLDLGILAENYGASGALAW